LISQAKSAVVIGAGPGGLATAMLLAAAGVKVTVVERRHRVGGRTSAIESDGFRFDMGPTFFLYPAVLEQIFDACGRNLWEEVELKRLDPQYHLIYEAGGDLLATPDVDRMKRQIASVSPQDAAGFERFLADNRRKFANFTPVLQREFDSWKDLLDPSLLGALPLLRPWASVDRDLKRYFEDPRIRLAFSFQSKYLGMSPFQCPSLFTILSFLEYEYGVYHPIGGCAALTEAMARIASEMGVEIRLNEPVTEVLLRGERAIGVRTPEGDRFADAIVINADFAEAMRQLVPDRVRRRWSDRKLTKKKYSCSTFMMYLGIKGRYDGLHHHTIYLAEDYRKNLRQIERDFVLPDSPSFYVQNACVTDPTLASEGMSTLYCLAPVSHEHENLDWEAARPRFRRRLLDQMAKIGLGDVESRIRFEHVMTPTTWREDLNIYRGATFNLAHTFGQMLHNRPRNRFEELDGVYLVGGGTHPGSGLPVIFESARISARLLLQDLGVTAPQPVREQRPPERGALETAYA